MRSRLLLAVPVLLLGFVALLLASAAAPSRDAQNSALARALAHPPKAAEPATTEFIKESAKAERDGYLHRKAGKVRAKGWVSVQSAPHGKDGKTLGDARYFLHTPKRSIELHPAEGAGLKRISSTTAPEQSFESGQIVEVNGRKNADGGVDVQNVAYVGKVKSPEFVPVSTAATLSTRKVAVVLSYAPGRQGDLATETTLMNTLQNGPKSVRNYFLQLTSNRLSVTFKVFPAVEGRANKCGDESDYDQLAVTHAAVNAAAAASGDSLDNYDSILNIVAADPTYTNADGPQTCGWFAGGDTYLRNSGYRQQTTGGPSVGAVAHELGHNWGLEHANAAISTSNGAPVAIASKWRHVEYGDGSSHMGFPFINGADNQAGFSGPELVRFGAIGLDQTKDITAQDPSTATALQLRSVDQDLGTGSEPRVLRIRRPSVKDVRAPDAYLYLDLREKIVSTGRFVDQFKTNDPILSGVSVRFGPTYGAGYDSFRVLDSSPGRRGNDAPTADYPFGSDLGNERNMRYDGTGNTKSVNEQDFAVAVGQSMYDPVENITISTESIAGGVASVKVTTGPPPGNPTNVYVAAGRLYVDAGAGRRNNVILNENEGRIIITDVGNRVTASTGCKQLDPQAVSCSKTEIKSAFVTLDQSGDAFSDLGAVFGSLNLPITWSGGGGQDSLEGGPGDDIFSAGPGGADGADADIFAGNGGNDRVSYSGRAATVKVNGSNGLFQDGEVYTVAGQPVSERDDVGSDVNGFVGGSGNDEVQLGTSTPQYLLGGPGADQLIGGPGADTIVARDSANTDAVTCGGGSDQVFRDSGDTVSGCSSSVVAPQIEFLDAPAEDGATNVTNPSFSFFALNGTGITYTCKLESGTTPGGATPGPCSTTTGSSGTFVTSTSPAAGTYVFTVTGTISGVQTSLSRSFRIDRAAPTVMIDSGPPASTDAAGSNFELSMIDAASPLKPRFECALQTAPFGTLTWESCGASVRFPDLTPGSYRLTVRAIDQAGNVSSTKQQDWTVTLDTILDSARDVRNAYTAAANGDRLQFNNERPAFTFHASGPGATLWCKTDAQAWLACGAMPWRPSPLDLSLSHTIKLAAGDINGPTDATPLEFTSYGSFVPFAIDTRITGGPAEGSWINTTSATFTSEAFRTEYWHGRDVTIPDDVRKFECRTDAITTWFPCGSPFTVSGLAQGLRSFYIRAVRVEQDAAGKVVGQRIEEDWTPVKRQFNVDTTAPTVVPSIDSGPANGSTVTTDDVQFTFSQTGETSPSFECKRDLGSWLPCASPVSVSSLTNGSHSWTVRVIDRAGNAGPAATARTFTVAKPKVLSLGSATVTPSNVTLSTAPAGGGPLTDWIHWRTTDSTLFDRMSGGMGLSTWTALQPGQYAASVASGTIYGWTDSTNANPSGLNVLGTASGRADGAGFGLTVPATSAMQRKLRVYVGYKGTGKTYTLAVKFGDNVVQKVDIVATSDSVADRYIDVTYRPTGADTLNVTWSQTAGGASTTAAAHLYAAVLY